MAETNTQQEIKRRTAELDEIAATIEKWEAGFSKINELEIIQIHVQDLRPHPTPLIHYWPFEFPFSLVKISGVRDEARETLRKHIGLKEVELKQKAESLRRYIKEKGYGE